MAGVAGERKRGSSVLSAVRLGAAARSLASRGVALVEMSSSDAEERLSLVSSGGLQASQLATSTARILEQKYRFHADKTSGYGLQPSFTNLDSGSGSIQSMCNCIGFSQL